MSLASEPAFPRRRRALDGFVWRQSHRLQYDELFCAQPRQLAARKILGPLPTRCVFARLPNALDANVADQCAANVGRRSGTESLERFAGALPRSIPQDR